MRKHETKNKLASKQLAAVTTAKRQVDVLRIRYRAAYEIAHLYLMTPNASKKIALKAYSNLLDIKTALNAAEKRYTKICNKLRVCPMQVC